MREMHKNKFLFIIRIYFVTVLAYKTKSNIPVILTSIIKVVQEIFEWFSYLIAIIP